MGGVIGLTLTACTTDSVYDDVDQQENTTLTNNTNDSGDGKTPFSHVPGATDYLSPWDFEFNTDSGSQGTPTFYQFTNHTGDLGSPCLLTLRVTPYVGLAYYDDTNDGDYFGYDITSFPTLYANNNEIGNFVPAASFDINGTGIPAGAGTVNLDVESSTDHCPVMPNILATSNSGGNVYFDVSPIVGGGSAEEKLLKDYGKVFYYFVEAINPVTNAAVWSGFIMPQNHQATSGSGFWSPTGVNAPLTGGPVPLWYNVMSLPTGLPSKEVIIDPSVLGGGLYRDSATFPFNGYTIFIEATTDDYGMYLKMHNL